MLHYKPAEKNKNKIGLRCATRSIQLPTTGCYEKHGLLAVTLLSRTFCEHIPIQWWIHRGRGTAQKCGSGSLRLLKSDPDCLRPFFKLRYIMYLIHDLFLNLTKWFWCPHLCKLSQVSQMELLYSWQTSWIAMAFGANIHGPQRIYPNAFDDPLTFNLEPQSGQNFDLSNVYSIQRAISVVVEHKVSFNSSSVTRCPFLI